MICISLILFLEISSDSDSAVPDSSTAATAGKGLAAYMVALVREDPIITAILAAGLTAVSTVGMAALIMPTATQAALGSAPVNAPQPGSLGGGSPPVPNNPTSAQALSLTPPGLIPVAIFPVWLTTRTFPAVAVIFSENPQFGGNLVIRRQYLVTSKRYTSILRSKVRLFFRRNSKPEARKNVLTIWKAKVTNKLRKIKMKTRCFGAKILTKTRNKFWRKKQRYRKRKRPLKECQEPREMVNVFMSSLGIS